ncbi:hypothetical protein DFR29_114103 [Tahibacter aquaticus]|uniref:Uncharacterized protein n=1 Tax=Tahibacter aquaticus TaxID=520092 RepID=A0A4R6YQ69_9GAMM|nr:hypothetical protein [Tahibacter aquaticus]TDR40051.1 hypothetical protein DFR29_114103 [Tahibacter aquaticus]
MSTTGQSNADFLQQHAAAARIGLAGGSALIDRGIRKAQRLIVDDAAGSAWSHAFLIGEQRSDGQWWVLESDLDLRHKQIRLGAQENRLAKYFDAAEWPNLAVLDFGLDAAQTRQVLATALDLLANATRYSLREIVGTLFALAKPSLRERDNLLAREGSLYCSAFVQHCYASAGIRLAAGLATKNTTPHDIARSRLPHRAATLLRQSGASA